MRKLVAGLCALVRPRPTGEVRRPHRASDGALPAGGVCYHAIASSYLKSTDPMNSFLGSPLAIILALVAATPLNAQSLSCSGAFHLATIEPDGKVSSGSLNALVLAYRSGQTLRVGWELDFNGDESADITH